MKWLLRLKNRPFFIRLLNWEYWPYWAYYYPLIPYFLYLAIRFRHTCFFSPANPGILTGGLGFESKYSTLLKIPGEWTPKSIQAPAGLSRPVWTQKLASAGIGFPLIAKPDIGFRGFLVKKIRNPEELESYLAAYPVDFILQEYVDFPMEFGILYHRFPASDKGEITSITLKEFLQVEGNGTATLRELIRAEPRALLQLERIEQSGAYDLDSVPPKQEKISLGAIGNHSKGTRFINGMHLLDEQLLATFDRIASRIDGFFYGRFDLRAKSWDSLRTGTDFFILELNGVCSEPTHIYDQSKSTYWTALGSLFFHWNLVGRIGMANRKKGVKCIPPADMLREIHRLRAYFKKIKMLVREG